MLKIKKIYNLGDADLNEGFTDAVNMRTAKLLVEQNLENRLGRISSNSNKKALLFGDNTWADHDTSITIGTNAATKGENSLALGHASRASHGGIAIGAESIADSNGVVSFGQKGLERRLTNVDKGINDTDAATLANLNEKFANTIKLDGNGFDAGGQKISNVLAGEADTDVATIADVNRHTKELEKKIPKSLLTDVLNLDEKTNTYNANGNKISNLADAEHETDAVNVKTAKSLINKNVETRLGKINEKSIEGALVIGNNALADHINAIAIGTNAETKGKNSLAFGNDANAQAGGIAIGNNSFANGNVVSFGKKGLERRLTNVDKGINDTDAATLANLNEKFANTIKLDGNGFDAGEKQISNVLAGEIDTDVATVSNLKQQRKSLEQTIENALSNNILQLDKETNSYYNAKGNRISNLADAKTDTDAVNVKTAKSLINKNVETRLGKINEKSIEGALVIGNNALADHINAIAIGTNAETKGKNSLAFGNDANAQAGGIAIGNNSFANGNVVSFGNKGLERRLTNVDKGINDTDAATLANLNEKFANTIKLDGNGFDAGGQKISNVLAGKIDTDVATIADVNRHTKEWEKKIPKSLLTDTLNLDKETNSYYNAKGNRISNLADAKTDTDAVNVKTAKSLINKNVETRLGKINEKSIEGALVIGNNALADHINAIAIGTNAETKGKNSLAFGNDANAQAGGIAIGNNSFANGNVVSFGKKGLERRLTNVDKGINDTDAATLANLNEKFANTIKLDGNGFDAGEKQISNVLAGEIDTDVATVSNLKQQRKSLEQTIENALSNNILQLDKETNSYYNAKGNRISNLADAKTDTDAVNVKTAKSLINKNVETRLGKINEKSIEGALVIGNNALADHINAIAIGTNAETKGKNSLAFGNDANASGGYSYR
ncbi:hypothetical protein [Bartonella sp. DGB1]|uniref:hypothetical protein n=1 Tax=Bartonella sp. DGB1 TaxID=3239807 RepID=UPI0035256EBD